MLPPPCVELKFPEDAENGAGVRDGISEVPNADVPPDEEELIS